MITLKISPRTLARLTGGLYLYIMAAAMFAEAFVRDRLIVSGDAAATLGRIASSEQLWRWGVAADVSTTLCDVAVAALLYLLLRPVSRAGSFTAACFRLTFAAAMLANATFLAVTPWLIANAAGLPAMERAQAQSLVMYSLHLHAAGFAIALMFFGVHLVMTGALIARSTFLPAILGVGLSFAGICYVANSFIGLVAPAWGAILFPWILLPGFVAEAALTLWLLSVGVNPMLWLAKNQATNG